MSKSHLAQDVGDICELMRQRFDDGGGQRVLIGMAGPPASGKSTLAEAVVQHLNQGSPAIKAALLPMDGYHLDNRLLEERGLLGRKGAPETFDARGFCEAVARLQTAKTEVFLPCFDRDKDLAIANAICVEADVKIIVVEGNYLLLKADPWRGLKGCFALTVFLSPKRAILEQRLYTRWIDQGLPPEAARQRTLENDLPNADLVLEHSTSADVVLTQD